jgi:ribokinase
MMFLLLLGSNIVYVGCVTCLNPAPCPDTLSSTLKIDLVDVMILNQEESACLLSQLDRSGLDVKDTEQRAARILALSPSASVIVITCGADGASCAYRVADTQASFHAPVRFKVHPVDTTGAGDTFVGYLVATLSLNRGISKSNSKLILQKDVLATCIDLAIVASGLACENKGAMVSIPSLAQVEARNA